MESAFRTGHNHMEISLADFKHNMGIYQKAGIFLKNRYVELKNKREKNK